VSTPSSDALFNRRLAIIITASFFFGVVMSIIKGNEDDIRGAIGNMCAPWMLLPFLSSVFAKKYRIIQAAIVGFLASICALIGFYFANSYVLDLGPHPWLVKVRLTLWSGLFYYKLSLLSGPVFGALGAWYIRRKTCTPALLMALLFVLEPFVWLVYDFGGFRSYPILAVVEATIGVIACIVLVIRCKVSRLR
jgi:Family of unknown function (DUF6518)